MNKKLGTTANVLSMVGSVLAIPLAAVLFYMLLIFGLASALGGTDLGGILYYIFFAHVVIIIANIVFTGIGFTTKKLSPEKFLKRGWLTIINIILNLLDVIVAVVYICIVPQLWLVFIVPMLLFLVGAVLYIVDYAQHQKAYKAGTDKQQVEVATETVQTTKEESKN